ncbi:hypothetical protein HAX54_051467 [Datura stramonium]|uniref:Uncharacterized protein n=1 Tax=Datura stramonium TaxID=4076 RepID=A0ABS8SYL8_DATST|nr:hypothetical protein [Datura stramonium]
MADFGVDFGVHIVNMTSDGRFVNSIESGMLFPLGKHIRAPPLEPEFDIEHLQHQLEGVGPVQPPARFVAKPVLQDTMVRILSFLEGISQARAFPGTLSGSQVRGEAQTST